MRKVGEHEYTTYPRRFKTYKWYKPLLVFLLFVIFLIISMFVVESLTKKIFSTTINVTHGYDGMDFFSAAGAFYNGAQAAVVIPCLLIAASIVKDRPVSSYFSSMGGWRWKIFAKCVFSAFIILGIPSMIWLFIHGRNNDTLFTVGGFILLNILIPLQGLSEELLYRGYFMQTVSSWCIIPAIGVIAQIVVFTFVHPYNTVGLIGIAFSAVIYALACILSKGLEAPTALHIANNLSELYMTGFGYGLLTSDQSVSSMLFNLVFKILYLLFIIYATKKLHWFDEVKYDDVTSFNESVR